MDPFLDPPRALGAYLSLPAAGLCCPECASHEPSVRRSAVGDETRSLVIGARALVGLGGCTQVFFGE